MSTAEVITVAGPGGTRGYADGIGVAALFNFPQGLGVDAAGTVALVVSCAGVEEKSLN